MLTEELTATVGDLHPKLADVPKGWHFVRVGKVKAGDKFWRYGNGSWKDVDVKSRIPVRVGEEISILPHYIWIIRRDSEK
jgi:hypothetical protein